MGRAVARPEGEGAALLAVAPGIFVEVSSRLGRGGRAAEVVQVSAASALGLASRRVDFRDGEHAVLVGGLGRREGARSGMLAAGARRRLRHEKFPTEAGNGWRGAGDSIQEAD